MDGSKRPGNLRVGQGVEPAPHFWRTLDEIEPQAVKQDQMDQVFDHQIDARLRAAKFAANFFQGPAKGRLLRLAEEAVALKAIAEAIGKQLGLPVVSKSPDEARDHFGWFAPFAAMDAPASSDHTRRVLGWQPVQPGLLSDLADADYLGL